MDYFPIFLRLAGEPVLVVGGGEVAARKVDLLLRAHADVTVVAPEIGARLATLVEQRAIAHVRGEFQPEHLEGMRLAVAATDRVAVNAWVAHQAEARGIDVNVVDNRELSRFIMPAIVDRSPVIAAISSGGDAPVLTRRLREQLEAVLPHRLGKLARIAGQLRQRLRVRVTNPVARRRYWETFFDGPVATDVLAGRTTTADEAMLAVDAALKQSGTTRNTEGEVALVGAGPGDPGLLTLRALRVLQNADVVLYDRLVSDDVLDLARRDATRIYVGKVAGDSAAGSQESINQLLVKLAQEGKRVCRLKGGDPFIFGRGGEELEALVRHGIRYEVVPGVTAAIGCAAYAGIPLTHRDHAQTLTFVTGQGRDDTETALDWRSLAGEHHTVVFYMGLKSLGGIVDKLKAHGAPGKRAVAVIEQGTCESQRVITGTLDDVDARVTAAGVVAPSLMIVGEVARLHATLAWFRTTAGSQHLAESLTQSRLSA